MIMGGTPYSLHARRIADDAIVAGKNISVTKSEDGKLQISSSTSASKSLNNIVDGGTGGLRMLSCSTTVGDSAVALGRGSKASGNSAFAAGYRCQATANYSTAMGGNSISSGDRGFAAGNSCQATGAWVPIAIGSAAKATANNTVAIGTSCEANAEATSVFGIGCITATRSGKTVPSRAMSLGAYQTNNYINSLMLGWTTDNPSLFVTSRKVCVGFTPTMIDSIYLSDLSAERTSAKQLLVNGKIVGQELELKTDVWADYVFKNDYDLKPLSAVESHIKSNGHLPGIMPESEALAKGVNIGDVQVKLLEKIEELTLYLIEQDKQIKELQEKIK